MLRRRHLGRVTFAEVNDFQHALLDAADLGRIFQLPSWATSTAEHRQKHGDEHCNNENDDEQLKHGKRPRLLLHLHGLISKECGTPGTKCRAAACFDDR